MENKAAHSSAARRFEKRRARTGIKNLKAGVNRSSAITEIPRGGLDRVPAEYIRKQTLVNAGASLPKS